MAGPSVRKRAAIVRQNPRTEGVNDGGARGNVITIGRVRGQGWTARADAMRAGESKTFDTSRERSLNTDSHHSASGDSHWRQPHIVIIPKRTASPGGSVPVVHQATRASHRGLAYSTITLWLSELYFSRIP